MGARARPNGIAVAIACLASSLCFDSAKGIDTAIGVAAEPLGPRAGTGQTLEDACRRAGAGDPSELLAMLSRLSQDYRRSIPHLALHALGLMVAQRKAEAQADCVLAETMLVERRSQFIDPAVCRMLYAVYSDLGDHAAGLNLLRRTVQQHPRDRHLLNQLAWDLATLPDSRVRNGAEAMGLAMRACEETRWKDWQVVDTYAAASAENRQWDLAVHWQSEAIAMATKKSESPADVGRLGKRLVLYRAHRSHHDPVHDPAYAGWSRRMLQIVVFSQERGR